MRLSLTFSTEAAANTLPAVIAAPIASGTPTVGQTLSVTTGFWRGTGLAFTYAWKQDGTPIGGATASTYLVDIGDSGTTLTCTVTATNTIGSSSSTSNGIAIP